MRSPTWIAPALGSKTANQYRDDQGEEALDDTGGHQQFTFTEEQKQRFKDDAEYYLQFRKKIEAELNYMADFFIYGTDMQKDTQREMSEKMRARLGRGNDDLAKRLIPEWPPGCRRLTPGDNYLESLVKDNVEPIFGGIERIDETCLYMQDGTKHEVDILVQSQALESIARRSRAKDVSRFAQLASTCPLSLHSRSLVATV